MAKERDLEFDVFSMRLSEETKEQLKLKQKNSGLSWNIFIIKLLKSYEHETLHKVPRK